MTQYASVHVIGLDAALRGLSPERLAAGLPAGLHAVGLDLAAEVHGYIKPHHYTGRAEQQVHAEPPEGQGFGVHVFVGTSASAVPELRPLMYGWKSSGKRPPTDAIAKWLSGKPELAGSGSVTRSSGGFVRRSGTKSQISAEASVRSRAFLIARAIGRRGYSFGTGAGGQHISNFHDAWEAIRGGAARTILAHLRVGRP